MQSDPSNGTITVRVTRHLAVERTLIAMEKVKRNNTA